MYFIRFFFIHQLLTFKKHFTGNKLFFGIKKQGKKNTNAAILWTGGKDCNLALYEAKTRGLQVVCLITFYKKEDADLLPFLKKQAASLSVPLVALCADGYTTSQYIFELTKLKTDFSIRTVVTGSISNVKGNIFWFLKIIRGAKLKIFCPLWGANREALLKELIALKYRVKFIEADSFIFTHLIDCELSSNIIKKLKHIQKVKKIDICGENNEYNTLVLDGPYYHHVVEHP
ncbi:MAG: hypothetical protein JST67_06170 [Bacteroidetes bacterium]|nr:hypothetical protein [Bacteroidota bacterium]